MNHLFRHELEQTDRQDMIKITETIRDDISSCGVKDGIVIVYCPHTTAGITINENADPDVVHDVIYGFGKIYPHSDSHYHHLEGNSDAHLKSSTVGASQTVIIDDGKMILGTWQDIYFCEFDGPRKRLFFVKIIDG